MKSTEVEFTYPVLGITTDGDIWGFPDLNRLTKCGPLTLKDGMQDGMELIDADLRRHRVRAVHRVGRTGSILNYIPILGTPQSRIEQDLEVMPDVTLDEVKERVCANLAANPDVYGDMDDEGYDVSPRLAEVRAVKTMAEIHEVIGLDTFEAY